MWSFIDVIFVEVQKRTVREKEERKLFGGERKKNPFSSGGKSENAKWKQKEKKRWRKVEKNMERRGGNLSSNLISRH